MKKELINAAMAQLIATHYGCFDAAAAQIAAANGGKPNKSLISQRLSGRFSWPLEDISALEDGVGVYTVTNMMAQRTRKEKASNVSLCDMVGTLSKETGEAVQAALDLHGNMTPDRLARATIEMNEARDEAIKGSLILAALWASNSWPKQERRKF